MRIFLRVFGAFILWLAITGVLAYTVHTHRQGIQNNFPSVTATLDDASEVIGRKFSSVSDVKDGVMSLVAKKMQTASESFDGVEAKARDNVIVKTQTAPENISQSKNTASGKMVWLKNTGALKFHHAEEAIGNGFNSVVTSALTVLDVPEKKIRTAQPANNNRNGFINASYDIGMPPPPPAPLTLSEIKKRKQEDEAARMNAQTIPSAGVAAAPANWTPEQNTLNIQAVLVPRQVTVISSSQDGRIAQVLVNHGDSFKQGDLLIAYDCSSLKAEADIVKIQQDLTRKKVEGTDKLFKLDIISDLDRLGAEVEDKQTAAKSKLYDAKMQDCEIRAQFDGHVTNRLANPGEYTRTDRVLLEVASDEPLQAEFLVPSKWLRWVNVGAPLSISLGETEKTYTAKIARIHGEVDPVSQSIQMIATLDPYDDPLLPGMSGQATIDIEKIRQSGVRGYLETTPVSYRAP